jgi:hypothetical protein
MSLRHTDQSSSSRDQDHKKYNSKSQMESDTVKKYKAQSPKPANKPIAFVSPQKRISNQCFPNSLHVDTSIKTK